jgi:uncharacterized protein YcgI (DUF1989 family)
LKIGSPLDTPCFSCYEILQKALKDWPIAPEDIPEPLNLFQTMGFNLDMGTLAIADGRSKPGDHVDFVAEMDVLCALSACPSTLKPLRVEIYEA